MFSGFLGSGKTSALLHIIRQLKEKGIKPAVFMNEIGSMSFDSDQIGNDTPLKEILEGCICCTGSELVEAQLQQLLAEQEFDVLLIETTGAAHPIETLDAVFSPLFADQLEVKGIITIVDSTVLLLQEKLSTMALMLFHEQIKHAHLLIANKMDELTDNEQMQVVQSLQSKNKFASIVQTSHGKFSSNELEKISYQKNASQTTPVKIGTDWPLETSFFRFSAPISIDMMENWLKSLPDTVYRMKGYVPIEGSKYPYVFQYSYGMVQWLPEYVKVPTGIVIIGERLQEISLKHVNLYE
ncbi:GTP-binding protein [Paenisporosarcina cavernae]|uniref:GTP-binding protein n=1 Tax=Paenisporosarcina cavernae TaxID=2320858 RepID=A0A385YW68_9BACL|nr:GTP-binding protein [Paenisporosarcina cavernae]